MLAHNVKELGAISAGVGGWEDHVHLAVGLPRTLTVANLVQGIKCETSKWAKDAKHGNRSFSWQAGYGVFSISHSNLQDVLKYISTQDEHHAQLTYQEEFRLICERHGVAIDERYVWD